ncbi:MAG: TonB-dependent receptor [Opitutales bacterium]
MNYYFLGTALAGSLLTTLFTHAEPKEDIYLLEDYIVSAGPGLRAIQDFAAPVEVLNAEALKEKNASNLGALLDGMPGVAATSFTAGASRPILRGFDGPRVRILDSGIQAFDVSETSADHAVALEPLLIDRVEVLRGPSTLLYGGSAIGGAINVVDKSLPRERAPASGFGGAVETRYDSVSNGKTSAGHFSTGNQDWVLRATALERKNDNYRVPKFEEPKLDNSFQESRYYSLGATRFFGEDHYFGLAYTDLDSDYGVPGHEHEHHGGGSAPADEEEGVYIEMETRRLNAEYQISEPFAWAEALRLRAGHTDYYHEEIVDGASEISYDRTGWELRGEIAHKPWAAIDTGIVGIQFSNTDTSIVGDEAFIPNSEVRNGAIFFNEHWHGERLHYELGGRLEHKRIEADGIANHYSDEAISAAASAIWNIDAQQTFKLSLQRSQRHPTTTELYSGGTHIAAQRYERGDPSLEVETALGLDLTYEFARADDSASVTVFYTRFDDYINCENLGYETDDEGRPETDPNFEHDHALDTYQYEAVDANFYGIETSYERVLYRKGEDALSLNLMADWIQAEKRGSGESLPRIPPVRLGIGLDYASPDWKVGLDLTQALRQKDTATYESETSGYTQLDAHLSKSFALSSGQTLSLFANANNLLDRKIVHHTSYLKEEVPLPGRNIAVGLRMEF